MATNPPRATVLGFAFDNPTTEFPVRSGPGTNFERTNFTATKDTANLEPLDVQPDAQGTPNDLDATRAYQWFMFEFPNGQTGWLRGHVVGIAGDWRAWGYGVVDTVTHAYLLVRDESMTGAAVASPIATNAAAQMVAMPAQLQVAEMTPAAVQTSIMALPEQQTMQMAGVMSGDPIIIVKSARAVNARTGPSTDFDRIFSLEPETIAPLLEVEQEPSERPYNWYQILHEGQDAWVREDFCTYHGATDALGLPEDLYPIPFLGQYSISRGHNFAPNRDPDLSEHDGWDYVAAVGEPLVCGPNGGTVVVSFQCTRCTPERPSVIDNGLQLSDPSIFSDEGWGFGFGNYVIARYLNDQLPQSTQDILTARGFADGHIFALYAHLQARSVEAGAELAGGTQIGTCGNTGNSSAPHLHLQLRASRSPDFSSFSALRDGRMDPVVLFRR